RPVPERLVARLSNGPTARRMSVTWRTPTGTMHVGAPVSLELVVSGAGNVSLWPQAALEWPAGIRVYDEPTVERVRRGDGLGAGPHAPSRALSLLRPGPGRRARRLGVIGPARGPARPAAGRRDPPRTRDDARRPARDPDRRAGRVAARAAPARTAPLRGPAAPGPVDTSARARALG